MAKVNKDFYRDLPGMVCILLDKFITQYGKEEWFPQAWEEYRQHIKSSSIDDMKMPGFVFNKYIKESEMKHSASPGYNWTKKNDLNDELYHHGILGQKWGVRRFENADGTLTEAGKLRYGKGEKGQKNLSKSIKKMYKAEKSSRSQPLNTSEAFRNKITNKVVSLISKEDVDNLAIKREKAIKLSDKADHIQEEIWDKAAKEAYKETFNWFKKNDPEYLNEIIKNNNGDEKGLDAFHDFRKTFEGYHDYIGTKMSDSLDSKSKKEIKEADDAWEDYIKASKEVTDKLLGKYGNEEVNGETIKYIVYHSTDMNKLISMYPNNKIK